MVARSSVRGLSAIVAKSRLVIVWCSSRATGPAQPVRHVRPRQAARDNLTRRVRAGIAVGVFNLQTGGPDAQLAGLYGLVTGAFVLAGGGRLVH